MGYIKDLEPKLRALYEEGDEETLIKFVKDRCLESYKNGIRDGKVEPDTETARTPKQRAREE